MPEDDKKENLDESHKEERDDIDVEGIDPEEVIDNLPEEERKEIGSIISRTMIARVMGGNNPVSDKITSEHITQIISTSDEKDKRDREERKSERNYNLLLTLIGLIFAILVLFLFQTNEELLIKLIIAVISFVGGFGIGRSRKDKKGD